MVVVLLVLLPWHSAAAEDAVQQLKQQQQLKYQQALDLRCVAWVPGHSNAHMPGRLVALCRQHSFVNCTPPSSLSLHCTALCRSKRGASTRDLKHSIELLKFAAGLVPAPSARQHAATQQGSKQQVLPVQGFPHLAFNGTGRADALRELAKAYQVRVRQPQCYTQQAAGTTSGTWDLRSTLTVYNQSPTTPRCWFGRMSHVGRVWVFSHHPLIAAACAVPQRGSDVDVNHKLSLELFRRAADLGDPEAQGMMGMRMAVGLHHYGSFEGSSIRMFVPVRVVGCQRG